jgi:hypothetical protein
VPPHPMIKTRTINVVCQPIRLPTERMEQSPPRKVATMPAADSHFTIRRAAGAARLQPGVTTLS